MTMSTEVTRDVAPWNQAGVHGVPRPRQWDAVVTAEADLPGDSVHFVTLEDRTVVVDEDVPDDQLAPLADAVETQLDPPYRAEGTRRETGCGRSARARSPSSRSARRSAATRSSSLSERES